MASNFSSKIKYLLWDNDGVLVNTEQFYYEAGRRVLADVGVTLTMDHFKKHSLRLGNSVFDVARAAGFSEAQCLDMRKKRDRLYSKLLATEDFFISGVENTVERCAQHYRMCIVSSSMKNNFYEIHARTGEMLSHFEFCLLNGDYPRSKPHPDPWLTAMERFGALPSQCVVIEDSPRGIQAAKAAGMTVVAVASHFFKAGDLRPYLQPADRCISQIGALPNLLSRAE